MVNKLSILFSFKLIYSPFNYLKSQDGKSTSVALADSNSHPVDRQDICRQLVAPIIGIGNTLLGSRHQLLDVGVLSREEGLQHLLQGADVPT